MPKEVSHFAAAAATPYFRIWDKSGNVWNGSAFVTYNGANLSTYKIAMTQQGTANVWFGDFPTAIPTGRYFIDKRNQAGGAPAETDAILSYDESYWDKDGLVLADRTAGISADTGARIRQFVQGYIETPSPTSISAQITDPKVAFPGPKGTFTYGGQGYQRPDSHYWYAGVKFVGNRITALIWMPTNGSSIPQYRIDGGAWRNVKTDYTTMDAHVTLDSLLAYPTLLDGTHLLEFRETAAQTNGLNFRTTNCFTIYGAAPSLLIADTIYRITATENASYFNLTGNWLNSVNFGNWGTVLLDSPMNDGENLIEFNADLTTLDILMYASGQKLRVYRDGFSTPVADIVLPTNPGMDWVNILTDVAPGYSKWTLRFYSGTNGRIHSIRLRNKSNPGSYGRLNTATIANLPACIGYGDSIQNGFAFSDSSTSYVPQIAALLNMSPVNLSWDGSTAKQFGSGATQYTSLAGENTGRLGYISNPYAGARTKRVLYAMGTNDMAQSGGAETTTDLQNAATNIINGILSRVPTDCLVDVLGILPRVGFTTTTWNAAIQAAVTSVNNPRVRYVSMDIPGWSTVNGVHTTDGTHPNAAGYTLIVNWLRDTYLTPSQPTSLTATPGDSQVALSWVASTQVQSYTIHRDGIAIGTTTGTSYVDTTAKNLQSYAYTVTPYNGQIVGPISASVTVKCGPIYGTDGANTLSEQRQALLALAVLNGAFSVTDNPTLKTRTVTYFLPDATQGEIDAMTGTKILATQVTYYTDSSLQTPVKRLKPTFANLP